MSERPEKNEDGFTIIYSKDDLPIFENGAPRARPSGARTSGVRSLWTKLLPKNFLRPPVRKRSTSTSLRLDEDTLGRLRHLARKKGKGYQTLLKEFVVERLYEEEKREGMLGQGNR